MSWIRIRIGGANRASEDDVRPPRRPNGNVAFRVRGRGKVEDGALFLLLFVFAPYLSLRVFVGDVFS